MWTVFWRRESYTAGDVLERLPPLPCEEPGRKEMHYYATCINHRLRGDPTLSHVLPLQPDPAVIAGRLQRRHPAVVRQRFWGSSHHCPHFCVTAAVQTICL